MKAFLILSTLLLVANGVLFRHWLAGRDSATMAGALPASKTVAAPVRSTSRPEPSAPKDNLAALAESLRKLGLSDRLVRNWIAAEIDELYRAKEEALQPTWKKVKFWQQAPAVPLATKLALLDIQREKARLKDEVLGYDPSLPENAPYRFLPPEKQRETKRITEEFTALIQAYRTNAGYMPTDAEMKQIEGAEADRKKALAGLLTDDEQLGLEMRTALLPRQPREFAQSRMVAYDRRTTPIALRLAEKLQFFDSTEDEFREIYQVEQVLDPTRGMVLGRPMTGVDLARQNREMTPVLNDQLKTELGDARYADYVRASTDEFQRIGDLAQRLAAPADTPAKYYDIRDSITAESTRIANDAALSVDEKRVALKSLADNARGQLGVLLGPEGLTAAASVVNQLLTPLEQGRVRVSIPGSNATMLRDVGAPPLFQPK